MSNFYDYNSSWDQDMYQTGPTKPQKSHTGLIAFLLMLVILLAGIVTILGFLNIRMFQQLNEKESGETNLFSNTGETGETPLPSQTLPNDPQPISDPAEETMVTMATSPESPDNTTSEDGLSLQEIYTRLIDSVVSISCSYYNGSSSGTGVVLTRDGYIVTNCHVVDGAERIYVLFSDGRNLEATLVGADEISDLAVLRVDAQDLIPAQLGDSSSMRVGDLVVAIGDPLGMELRGTMTDGIVSAINRDITVEGRVMSVIQTNAALNSGNSGGPLINCYGQVIGINTMKIGDYVNSAGVEGLGFAIPSTTVVEITNQLISQGYVSGRATLGITGEGISSFYQLYYRLPEGLYITEVEPGSCSAEAGIQEGDILLKVDNTRITCLSDLKTLLYGYEPGDSAAVLIYRAGKQYAVTLTVDEAT